MISVDAVRSFFNDWNDALKSKNRSEVLKLYAEDAVLLPTMSALVRHNHAEIGDYFDMFLQFNPCAVIQEENIRMFGEIAINSGIYVFELTQDNKTFEVAVRFTFVYKKFDQQWLIVEHHSSSLPA
jgi:uncharacterized protein (TIGR02246 family)